MVTSPSLNVCTKHKDKKAFDLTTTTLN